MQRTARKVIALAMSFVALLTCVSTGLAGFCFLSLNASAQDNPGELLGLNVTFVDESDAQVDFIDTGLEGKTYRLKIENKSPVTATITGIESKENLDGFTENTRINAGDSATYTLKDIINKTGMGTGEAGKSAKEVEEALSGDALAEFTEGGVYDFTVSYKLENVHNADGADAVFTQPAYIGTWNTSEDAKGMPVNDCVARVDDGDNPDKQEDGSWYKNAGLSVYREKKAKIDVAFDIELDNGIIHQTSIENNASVDDSLANIQLFVDSTDIEEKQIDTGTEKSEEGKRWQDIGFRVKVQSWGDVVHFLPSNHKDGGKTLSPGKTKLDGNIDSSVPFSFFIENVQNHDSDANASSWTGSQSLPTWTVKSRAEGEFNDGYVAGNDQPESQRGYAKGSSEGKIEKGVCYFPITGFMFKSNTDSGEPAVIHLGTDEGDVSGHEFFFKILNENNHGASFRIQIDCYIFDKTELRNLVNETIAAPASERYKKEAWEKYDTALQNARKQLASHITTQKDVTDAYTQLQEAYNALESEGIDNKVVKVTHELYNGGTGSVAEQTYTEYVLAPLNAEFKPNEYSAYAGQYNKTDAKEQTYTDGRGIDEATVKYWTGSDLTIDLNGGTAEGGNDGYTKYKKTISGWKTDTRNLPTVGKTGFTFDGWMIKEGESGEAKTFEWSTYIFDATDDTLTAKWKIEKTEMEADNRVVEFGLPLKINPLENDLDGASRAEGESVKIAGICLPENLNAAPEASAIAGAELNLEPSDDNSVGTETTVQCASGTFTLDKSSDTITYMQTKNAAGGGRRDMRLRPGISIRERR